MVGGRTDSEAPSGLTGFPRVVHFVNLSSARSISPTVAVDGFGVMTRGTKSFCFGPDVGRRIDQKLQDVVCRVLASWLDQNDGSHLESAIAIEFDHVCCCQT